MDILGAVIAGVLAIVGIVVYYLILESFKSNIPDDAETVLRVLPIVLSAVVLIAVVVMGFGRR